MAKQIVYGEQSRQAILRGVNQLADAVKVTRWEDTNLLAGLSYRYQVLPHGAAGQAGELSNPVAASLPITQPR